MQRLHELYIQYFKEPSFSEIDHVPNGFISTDIVLQDGCLVVSFQFFQYYPLLLKKLNSQSFEIAQWLLILNGQLDKAWHVKMDNLINLNQEQLIRQLRFTGAVCLKCKKSAIYYHYREKVIQNLLKFMPPDYLLKEQQILIGKVLSRFFRNYYCWMYRLKLIKLLFQSQQDKKSEIVRLEYDSVHKIIQRNPNDYSALNYLRTLSKMQPMFEEQQQWTCNTLQFCHIAYQNQSNYLHLLEYLQWLRQNILKVTLNAINQIS